MCLVLLLDVFGSGPLRYFSHFSRTLPDVCQSCASNAIYVLKDLNVDLCLHFNGECLEPALCFPRECSGLLQFFTISND